MHQPRDLQKSSNGIRRIATVTVLVLFLLLPVGLFGANVTIPTFQLLTRGILEGGQFSLETAGLVEIAFGGVLGKAVVGDAGDEADGARDDHTRSPADGGAESESADECDEQK